MTKRRYWICIAGLCLLALPAAPAAYAQAGAYPNKAVTIISDAAPGASPDVVIRIIADGLGKIWGQQAVVANRPGANGSIAARAASEAVGDGYTLYFAVGSTYIASPTAAPNLPVKLPRDFLPIGSGAMEPMFIAVSPSLGVTTLPELIALAKKEPGKISFAVTGVGRMTHLTGELLQERAGIKLLAVPYTGGQAAAFADLAAGRVSTTISGYPGIIGSVKAGAVKLIAVASPERMPEFPDLPTVAETIPGFSAAGWQVLAAPLGTPQPIIGKVSADLIKVESDPGFKERLATIGDYPQVMTPEQTLAFVQKEQETWLPVLQKISGQ